MRVYVVSSPCNISGQADVDNKVDNSSSEKVDKRLSAVDILTMQVNSLKSELREIKNEKRCDKYYSASGSIYLCRDGIVSTITGIIVTIDINVRHPVTWRVDVTHLHRGN